MLVDFGICYIFFEMKFDICGIGVVWCWIKFEFEVIFKVCGNCLEIIEVKDIIFGEKCILNLVEVVNIVVI